MSDGTEIFLFAHQDDEFGVFHMISRACARKSVVECVYLTSGAVRGVGSVRRNLESRSVLSALGVPENNIVFQGQVLVVDDGKLLEKAACVCRWLKRYLDKHENISHIYVPAWEGGHPDHDILHAITVSVADQLSLTDRVRQFSLYHSNGKRYPLFNTMQPLAGNGPVETFSIPYTKRLQYIFLCLRYPSQYKTWTGLFPFVAISYLFGGVQSLQRADPLRIKQRPHEGDLYYEKRGWATWDEVQKTLTSMADTIKN